MLLQQIKANHILSSNNYLIYKNIYSFSNFSATRKMIFYYLVKIDW